MVWLCYVCVDLHVLLLMLFLDLLLGRLWRDLKLTMLQIPLQGLCGHDKMTNGKIKVKLKHFIRMSSPQSTYNTRLVSIYLPLAAYRYALRRPTCQKVILCYLLLRSALTW